MEKLGLKMEIVPLDGFSEQNFIAKLGDNLQTVGVTKLYYGTDGNTYVFQVEYIPVPNLDFRPVLECFTEIERKYPYLKIISTELKDAL